MEIDVSRAAGPIHMTSSDIERLQALVDGYRRQGREGAALDALEAEIDRAIVTDGAGRLPAGVVTLDSRVVVVDLDSGEERAFTLVLPSKANVDLGRISVLAPLGMAVLGYRVGAAITWDVPGGRRHLLVRQVSR